MDKQKGLLHLVSDIQSFLLLLDSENLSYIAQAQKKSLSELLAKLQTSNDIAAEDAEYMIMNCPSGEAPAEADVPAEPSTERPASVCLDSVTVPQSPRIKDEEFYEEAEPFVPVCKSTETLDSDSSHYESYGEEEDEEFVKDRANYFIWSSSQPCLKPISESRICGYLWRKRWLGQWTRQLFIIKHSQLLCFKCAKDLHPLLDLNLMGCDVMYRLKQSKNIQHQLKVVAGAESIVMGFQSGTQAEEWRKIIEDVSHPSYHEPDSQRSSVILKSEQRYSSRSSSSLHKDEEEISNLSTAISSVGLKDKSTAAFLNVLMNCQWQKLWCKVQDGLLKMYCDETSDESPQYTVYLRGSDVKPGPDTSTAYRITIVQHSDQVTVLESRSADDKQQWVHLLQYESSTEAQSLYQRISQQSLSGFKRFSVPATNMYADNPLHQSQPFYSNSSMLEHMFQNSCIGGEGELMASRNSTNNSTRRIVEKLNLTGNHVNLRADSGFSIGVGVKPAKRCSFRRSLNFCSEQAQGGFLGPLLRRTTSAKVTLKKAPSALFIQHGRLIQQRRDWENDASG